MGFNAKTNISHIEMAPNYSFSHNKRWGILITVATTIAIPIVTCGSKCSGPLYMKSPRRGFYCDEYVSFIRYGVDLNYCKWYCLHWGSCASVSYNFVNNSCIITSKACLLVSLHPDYEIILFQPTPHYTCINWVDSPPTYRHLTSGNQGVARKLRNNELLLGKFAYDARVVCAVWESRESCLGPGAEYLQVGEHCSMALVSYTAGDALTDGAVLGSTLSNGTPLYVVNLQLNPNRGENQPSATTDQMKKVALVVCMEWKPERTWTCLVLCEWSVGYTYELWIKRLYDKLSMYICGKCAPFSQYAVL